MKKTLLFSNTNGSIFENPSNVKFNSYMNEYLKANLNNEYSLVYINAPGLGGEDNYLKGILNAFENIGINFNKILDIERDTLYQEVEKFIKSNNKIVYFLMGGNPLTQIEIIDKLDLRERIKVHDDLVIGFCAGAINLSKYAIITTDEDFNTPQSYAGIGRVDISIEPHYNTEEDENRNTEINMFCKKHSAKIYALPDESIIIVENGKIIEKGKVYYFN